MIPYLTRTNIYNELEALNAEAVQIAAIPGQHLHEIASSLRFSQRLYGIFSVIASKAKQSHGYAGSPRIAVQIGGDHQEKL